MLQNPADCLSNLTCKATTSSGCGSVTLGKSVINLGLGDGKASTLHWGYQGWCLNVVLHLCSLLSLSIQHLLDQIIVIIIFRPLWILEVFLLEIFLICRQEHGGGLHDGLVGVL